MIVFDIETGARPLTEIEHLIPPFDGEVGDFDPASVKLGNTKDAEKIREKIAAAAAAHEAAKANVGAAREAHVAKFLDRAALSPLTGQVLAVGFKYDTADDSYSVSHQGPLDSEADVIGWSWELITSLTNDGQSPFVGHNIYGFDLPFLVRRSWMLGVDVPAFIRSGRYWSAAFVDLMDVWACGSREFISLDTIAKAFGLAGKPDGINGGDFARLFATDKPAALEYLKNDLSLTWQVATKLRVA